MVQDSSLVNTSGQMSQQKATCRQTWRNSDDRRVMSGDHQFSQRIQKEQVDVSGVE